MAKQPARNALTQNAAQGDVPSLAELKALRRSQREASQRVEELKLRLFQITEKHMDQAISLIKGWIKNP